MLKYILIGFMYGFCCIYSHNIFPYYISEFLTSIGMWTFVAVFPCRKIKDNKKQQNFSLCRKMILGRLRDQKTPETRINSMFLRVLGVSFIACSCTIKLDKNRTSDIIKKKQKTGVKFKCHKRICSDSGLPPAEKRRRYYQSLSNIL